jgi:predicted ATPase/DNA-binding SARP family transcriptional activator
MSPSVGLEVRLLGPIEVRRDGTPIQLGGPRQRALLALLAVQPGRARSVDELVEELWSGEPSEAAGPSLRTYVARLRRSLAGDDALWSRDGGYALDIPATSIDAGRFEALVREAEQALLDRRPQPAQANLRQAIALWRGEPFGDVRHLPSLEIEAMRLEELRLHAVELRLRADLELGEAAGIVDELEALTQRHPHRERLWHHLMLALYRSGRQADALAAYHRARARLDDELGIDPGPELQALEAAILRQEVPAAAPADDRHNLPEPISTFIGRGVELGAIKSALENHRIVTLSGVGGVGKTRLAIEAARRSIPDYPDGVWFVDFSALRDPALVAAQVAAVVQVQEQQGLTIAERLTVALKTARALLVLDNCEHVRDEAARLAATLLRGARHVRILATSREVLGIPGELAHAVPPLELAGQALGPDAVRDSEAVRLFLDRAREASPGLLVTDATVETVARICADLDGLPLGIELAAARARVLAPAEIEKRLRDRFRFLVSWRALSPARHRTLREAMDWSYELLAPREQETLRRFAVFAGGATLDAVAAVCTGGDEAAALDSLERLVEASLLAVDTTQEPSRYRVLETVRQYGDEALDAAGERDQARSRHAAYFTRFAQDVATPLRSNVGGGLLPRVMADRDNARAAMAWSRDTGDWPALVAMADALWWLFWIRGELTEARGWLELAVQHPEGSDRETHASAMLGLAGIAWAQADDLASQRWAEAARAAFREIGHVRYEASALNTLGLSFHRRNDFDQARRAFEESLALLRSPDLDAEAAARNITVALDNLASTHHEVHDDAAARRLYLEARALNAARRDVEGVAMNDLHLAILDVEAGLWSEASERLASALEQYRSMGFLQYAAECLEAASAVANGGGAYRDAAFMLGTAGRLRDQAGLPPVPFIAALRSRQLRVAHLALGEADMEAELAAGRASPPDAAMGRAIAFLRG